MSPMNNLRQWEVTYRSIVGRISAMRLNNISTAVFTKLTPRVVLLCVCAPVPHCVGFVDCAWQVRIIGLCLVSSWNTSLARISSNGLHSFCWRVPCSVNWSLLRSIFYPHRRWWLSNGHSKWLLLTFERQLTVNSYFCSFVCSLSFRYHFISRALRAGGASK